MVPAFEKGQIDLEADYAGSLLNFLNGGSLAAAGNNITTAVPALKTSAQVPGVTVLDPAPAIDTNVFVVTKATAEKYHLTTISSLKPTPPSSCWAARRSARPTPAASRASSRSTASSSPASRPWTRPGPISVAALKNGEVQVVELFSSDGTVVSNNFVALTDNKHLEPADHIIPGHPHFGRRAPVWPRHSTPCRPS